MMYSSADPRTVADARCAYGRRWSEANSDGVHSLKRRGYSLHAVCLDDGAFWISFVVDAVISRAMHCGLVVFEPCSMNVLGIVGLHPRVVDIERVLAKIHRQEPAL